MARSMHLDGEENCNNDRRQVLDSQQLWRLFTDFPSRTERGALVLYSRAWVGNEPQIREWIIDSNVFRMRTLKFAVAGKPAL